MTDIELGGNIKLVGFKDIEPAKLVVVKKLVGNYARKIHDHVEAFQELNLTLKAVHATPEKTKNKKYEIMGRIIFDKKKPVSSEVTDFNLFFALDKLLQKLLAEAK